MARIFSALVLLPVVLVTIWVLPPLATLALAEVLLVLGFVEYAALAGRLERRVPRLVTAAAAMALAAVVGWPGLPSETVLMVSTVTLASVALASGRSGDRALQDVAVALFGVLYLALPLGAMVAVRVQWGPAALLLLLVTIMISDTAQYYGGRLAGRRLLAPAISPKKTVEGAFAGFIGGTAAMVLAGAWWLPGAAPVFLVVLGAAVVVLGMAGDLFESMLKRGAGVKDSSGLIPGHGGVLDRLDSLLFAAPVYYVVLRLATP